MDIERFITSFCDVLGHCREHKPCCYCEEAKRILNEALKLSGSQPMKSTEDK